ncbi:hypothetical protein FQA47_005351 [Oryzias melastigma]|uniref:Uncharacterized protein n=1 Tax=Oryzias melastigma TaxID=30732 RepID=A0A834CTA3_ORYME|nr:hypothetical protein FQA47_005351 [Oryzias melastigma]
MAIKHMQPYYHINSYTCPSCSNGGCHQDSDERQKDVFLLTLCFPPCLSEHLHYYRILYFLKWPSFLLHSLLINEMHKQGFYSRYGMTQAHHNKVLSPCN